MKHFEEVWEASESLHAESSKGVTAAAILNELLMKINLYQVLDTKLDINSDEKQKIKSRLFGEILFTLTNLSLQDNINVFEALFSSYKNRSIGFFADKYK